MYLFWHLVFAFLLALILYVVVVPNPVWPYLLTVVAAGVLIDVDHLLVWDPKYLSELFPTYLWEGLTFTVRTSVYPCILHLWIWPILLLAAALWLRNRRLHAYMLLTAAAAGWALHLALDGVAVLI